MWLCLKISRIILGETQFVYVSEYIDNIDKSQVIWKKIEVLLAVLCNGDLDCPLTFHVYGCLISKSGLVVRKHFTSLCEYKISCRELEIATDLITKDKIVLNVSECKISKK